MVGEQQLDDPLLGPLGRRRLGLDAVPFPYKMTTICFVGPSAYAPVHSALTLFRDEFEARIAASVNRDRVLIPVGAA